MEQITWIDTIDTIPDGASCRLMVFDLDSTGHHAGYIQHLLVYWQEAGLDDELVIVVAPDFALLHPTVVEQARRANIRFLAITQKEWAQTKSVKSVFGQTRLEWAFCRQYAEQLKAEHTLIMYFDKYQPAMLLSPSFPCSFSGIYFRPDFYYSQLENSAPKSWRERLQRLRKRLILAAVLRLPALGKLFCLDPFAVKALNSQLVPAKAVWLPDPVQVYPGRPAEPAHLKKSLGIEPGRRVALVFGYLDDRKGIETLIEAVGQLPGSIAQQLCILLVGPMPDAFNNKVSLAIEELRKQKPVQIIRQHEVIADEQIQPFFVLSDLILVLYQRHIGMSAVMVRAAAARKAILASDFGLLGKLVKEYNLGVTVDSASPTAVAAQLRSFIEEGVKADHQQMKRLAEMNRADEYARTIIETILVYRHG